MLALVDTSELYIQKKEGKCRLQLKIQYVVNISQYANGLSAQIKACNQMKWFWPKREMEGEWEQREEERKRSFSISVKASGSLEGCCCCCPFSREKSRVAAYDNVICKCDPQVLYCWYTVVLPLTGCYNVDNGYSGNSRGWFIAFCTHFFPAPLLLLPFIHQKEHHPTTWTQKNEGVSLTPSVFPPTIVTCIYSIDRENFYWFIKTKHINFVLKVETFTLLTKGGKKTNTSSDAFLYKRQLRCKSSITRTI